MKKKIPIIERRYQPDLKYRFGCAAIRLIGKITDVEIDFEPLAKPGDRVTGYVDCPHCSKSNLVTVSLFNETTCRCRNPSCCRPFVTMNDGTSIWVLLSGRGQRKERRMKMEPGREINTVEDMLDYLIARGESKALQKLRQMMESSEEFDLDDFVISLAKKENEDA